MEPSTVTEAMLDPQWPDISFSINKLSQYLSVPKVKHWQAVKRVFRYLKGTAAFGLHIKPSHVLQINGFSDADWATDIEDRKVEYWEKGGILSLEYHNHITPSRQSNPIRIHIHITIFTAAATTSVPSSFEPISNLPLLLPHFPTFTYRRLPAADLLFLRRPISDFNLMAGTP
ncbi:hypothetical protein L6164_010347 [Bauhinia variegata]|uniref:Uncharacterized protein n=1 Tax=Bauhinia variegata TaxID=167791 RepID=A0ACB9PN06_BAUVA|nr:hypothetical protein L6164_010347 [Bauhinia variegata]